MPMKATLFLSNGKFITVDMDFNKSVDLSTQEHRSKLEKKIVKQWNLSQPHMVNKVVKCHLFRN